MTLAKASTSALVCVLLGSMLLIGGGIYRYFKTHGWLDSDAGT